MLRASSLVNLLDEHLIFYSLFDKVSRLDFMTSCDRLKWIRCWKRYHKSCGHVNVRRMQNGFWQRFASLLNLNEISVSWFITLHFWNCMRPLIVVLYIRAPAIHIRLHFVHCWLDFWMKINFWWPNFCLLQFTFYPIKHGFIWCHLSFRASLKYE